MTSYVALLRGIAPTNPNMRNENLRRVAVDLGFESVQTFISSGNVLFESDSDDVTAMEASFEQAWPERFGFESTTIIRSRDELTGLADLEPFGDREHGATTYLLTTFAKRAFDHDFQFPFQPAGRDYWIVGGTDRELFSVTDTERSATPDVMAWMEREFGRDITSRTWLTVTRLLKRMS